MAIGLFTRVFNNDWIGPRPCQPCLPLSENVDIARPSFLSPFNIFVLLSAISVNMVIALGQLVIIAMGK